MVYLVGAGPGDEGLITVKGMECIKKCDTIIYDRLGTYQLLDYVKPGCRKIYVGKKAGTHYASQDMINKILVEEGKKKGIVVRLKGGDPYVFGRGTEEVKALTDNDIPYEVIPGITSAISVPEVCGIPVTSRMVSRSFHVITGHKNTGNGEKEFDHIYPMEGTSIFLMGLTNLPKIMDRLLQKGEDISTPVAVISNGTMPGQKIVRGTIENIVSLVNKNNMESPAIIVVGDNASFNLLSKDRPPIYGANIGIIGTKKMRCKMKAEIEKYGAKAYSLVDMCIEKTDKEHRLHYIIDNIGNYTWIAFTSANSVDIFFESLKKWNIDFRKLALIKFAVVGKGTGQALQENGFMADYMPDIYTTKAFAMGLCNMLTQNDRILVPRAVMGSVEFTDILGKNNIDYDEVKLYDVRPVKLESFKFTDKMDVILFASASGVRGFSNILADEGIRLAQNTILGAIGDVTKAEIQEHGYACDIIPHNCDIPDFIKAVVDYYEKRGKEND